MAGNRSNFHNSHRRAAAELLPKVYDELRELAASHLAQERPGQSLQATALVHEAYLKLVGNGDPTQWQGCGHSFATAAESMRRLLVDQARRKKRLKLAAIMFERNLNLPGKVRQVGAHVRFDGCITLPVRLTKRRSIFR